MSILYTTLASVYHEMYQQIFDYSAEFRYYDSIFKAQGCSKILEIGCGSGILAGMFLDGGYDYLGLDLHEEMLEIACRNRSRDIFIRGDMREMDFNRQFDAVLITGRSLAYIPENRGVLDTFKGVQDALVSKGLFVFGVFEATGIFGDLQDSNQEYVMGSKKVRRTNTLKPNLTTGWTFDLTSRFEIEKDGSVDVYQDVSTLRAFTEEEISLFLKLTGFSLISLQKETKTISVIARKDSST